MGNIKNILVNFTIHLLSSFSARSSSSPRLSPVSSTSSSSESSLLLSCRDFLAGITDFITVIFLLPSLTITFFIFLAALTSLLFSLPSVLFLLFPLVFFMFLLNPGSFCLLIKLVFCFQDFLGLFNVNSTTNTVCRFILFIVFSFLAQFLLCCLAHSFTIFIKVNLGISLNLFLRHLFGYLSFSNNFVVSFLNSKILCQQFVFLHSIIVINSMVLSFDSENLFIIILLHKNL